jgi:ribosomal protein S18 acetylase RimI-like enzyme
MRFLNLSLALLLLLSSRLRADDSSAEEQRIESAVRRSVALIENSGSVYRRERQCFSCHHQALPVIALTEVRNRGFAIDEDQYRQQLEHTAKHLKRGHKNYLAGKGQGGRGDTAGYALWTLAAGEWPADEVTAAVASYLTGKEAKLPQWNPPSTTRPPTAGSQFTSTALAIYSLQAYADEKQSDAVEARSDKARDWLLTAPAKTTEDQVFRLQSLSQLDVDSVQLKKLAQELLDHQREDGGWAQLPEQDSDAYATGTALVALEQSGAVTVSDPAFQRGVRYLLENQKEDGSWHVVTRAKPIQTYFESGFPHGKDQFISMAATCWSTMALAMTKEPAKAEDAQ